MTFDEAMDNWKKAFGPNAQTSADLLNTALEYWRDGMIGDDLLEQVNGTSNSRT